MLGYLRGDAKDMTRVIDTFGSAMLLSTHAAYWERSFGIEQSLPNKMRTTTAGNSRQISPTWTAIAREFY